MWNFDGVLCHSLLFLSFFLALGDLLKKQFMNNLQLPCEFLGRSFSTQPRTRHRVELTSVEVPSLTIN